MSAPRDALLALAQTAHAEAERLSIARLAFVAASEASEGATRALAAAVSEALASGWTPEPTASASPAEAPVVAPAAAPVDAPADPPLDPEAEARGLVARLIVQIEVATTPAEMTRLKDEIANPPLTLKASDKIYLKTEWRRRKLHLVAQAPVVAPAAPEPDQRAAYIALHTLVAAARDRGAVDDAGREVDEAAKAETISPEEVYYLRGLLVEKLARWSAPRAPRVKRVDSFDEIAQRALNTGDAR